jgi:hypothetical protein
MRAAGDHAAGLSLAVRRVSVVSAGTSSAALEVTDTLPPYTLVSGSGAVTSVAGRGEVTWRIGLVRHASGWRISSIASVTSSSAKAQP